MRKFLSVFVLLAVVIGGYFLGGVKATAASHTITTVSSNAVSEGNTSTTAVGVNVIVNGGIDIGDTVTVDVTCADGTAKRLATSPDDDYNCPLAGAKLTLTGGSTAIPKTIVDINGDTVSELNETFTIRLSGPPQCTHAGPGSCGTYTLSPTDPLDVAMTIVNDDGTVRTITISNASAAEGDATQHNDINFTVTLSRLCSVDEKGLVLNVATAGSGINPATEGVAGDYQAPPATLTFNPGDTTKTLTAKTNGDTVGEQNETFSVTLTKGTQPAGGTCSNNTNFKAPDGTSDIKATGTITDDDAPAGAAVRTACSGSASGDLNGDGRDDLAVGIPGQGVSAKGNAGAVQVIYGSATTGLQDAGKQFITQGANGVDDTVEAGDNVGVCLAVGNFNGDSFDDLAIGIPFEDVTSTRGSFVDAGAVEVIYGSSSGLNAAGSPADQFWSQDSPKVPGGAERGDGFGAALTAGDFNNDGRDDLAIGVPFEDIGNIGDAGAVNVLNGASAGLTATGAKVWFQDVKHVAGHSEAGDLFGAALAAGDLDHNGRDDLVIGVPGEAIGAVNGAGLLQVFRSGAGGLSAALDKLWFQGNASILDTAEASDVLGAAIAVADFNGDGFDDVAGGAPGEDLGTRTDVGAVSIIYGSSTGPIATSNELWSEADSTKTTGDTANTGDRFGSALTAGDFNADNFDDLAIGVPFNDVAAANAGSVNVVFGATTGLATPQRFHQGNLTQAVTNLGGEADDAFGSALTNGDYNGDAKADLAVGVPKENVGTVVDAGAVDVIPGSATTLVLTSDQYWTQDSFTVQGSGSQEGDQYGSSVA